jgi:anaerobic selenocysteine-containing dehydrogenase
VAPPGNQAANKENKLQPIISGETGLLDSSLLLAMINVMVKEELYDKEFVKEKAVGMGQLVDEIINYPMNGQRESARYRQISIPP